MSYDWIDLSRRIVPRKLRYIVQKFVSLDRVKSRWREQKNDLAAVRSSDNDSAKLGIKIGILENRAQYHRHYVQACLEMGLPFRVIDICNDDWKAKVDRSGCELFLAWPDATQRPRASLYKDRCDLIEKNLGFSVVPNAQERWLYEDKCRQRDWLQVHNINHPETWVFTDKQQAFEFATGCTLPIVFKTGFGASASGVRIIKTRHQLRSVVSKAFGVGHVANGHDHRDREWGRILLQEYIPIVREWRMVRIGDSYFGHPKGQSGQFHSGSGKVLWDCPGDQLFDLLHRISEIGGFRSMDIDIFETPDGEFLVNELQCVFGASTSIDQLRIDGKKGRMIRRAGGIWEFEEGDFARNACANERLRSILKENRISYEIEPAK